MRSAAFAALAVVILVAAATGVACGLGRSLPEGAELIPGDATLAISVGVPAILDSRIYKLYQSNEQLFGRNRLNFYRFAEATGLDPAKDIKRLVFMASAGEGEFADMSGLAIGNFDGRKVHKFLKDSGLPSKTVGGLEIFEFIVIQDRCRFCLAVVDASTAAFGDGETLEKIGLVKSGQAQGLAAEERAGRMLRRLGRDPEAWGIVRSDDLKGALAAALSRVSADSSALKSLGPIHELSLSFDTAEPMRILVELTASSQQDALMVADILKGAESLGRLTLRETKPELARLMSDFAVEADTGLVRVSGSLPTSDVDAVTQLLGIDWLTGAASSPAGPAVAPAP